MKCHTATIQRDTLWSDRKVGGHLRRSCGVKGWAACMVRLQQVSSSQAPSPLGTLPSPLAVAWPGQASGEKEL